MRVRRATAWERRWRQLGVAVAAALSVMAAPSTAVHHGRGDLDNDAFSQAEKILQAAITKRVFPGAVAGLADADGFLWTYAVGNWTYGEAPTGAVSLQTVYDLASMSKVVATTTAVAILYEQGYLSLSSKLSDFLEPSSTRGSHGSFSDITVRNCLLHNAGFPPDPTPFNFWDARFGCEGAPLPPSQTFKCSSRIYQAVLNQRLINPVGEVYLYSDLSMISLMYVVGQVSLSNQLTTHSDLASYCERVSQAGPLQQCHFEAFIRKYILIAVNASSVSGFRPTPSAARMSAPTTVPAAEGLSPSPLLQTLAAMQGRVQDGNSENLGGISGHAGFFATIEDIARIGNIWLAPSAQGILNETTVALFTKQANHTQSSRALGWNTNDPSVADYGWNMSCGNKWSSSTFMHIGYTGTMICIDGEAKYMSILLTNRVYPMDNSTSSLQIHTVRQQVQDAIAGHLFS